MVKCDVLFEVRTEFLNNINFGFKELMFIYFSYNYALAKKTSLWDIALCSLVQVYRRFRDAYCLHHQGDRLDDEGSTHL
jgi:hypothetical protein